MTLMITQLEPDPAPLLKRLATQARLAKTHIGRVQVTQTTGKHHRLGP